MKNKEKSFSIEHVAGDGTTYRGSFTCKRLSIREKAQQGVRKAQLNGGMYLGENGHGIDDTTNFFNEMISLLEIAVVQAPVWWNLDELDDIDLIQKVFTEVFEHDNYFRLAGRSLRSFAEKGGAAASQESDSAGELREMVGAEIQSALEP